VKTSELEWGTDLETKQTPPRAITCLTALGLLLKFAVDSDSIQNHMMTGLDDQSGLGPLVGKVTLLAIGCRAGTPTDRTG